MASIEQIVDVQISLNTTGISKEGFSTLLIVGKHCHSLARVETYSSADSMTAAGFTSDEKLYLAAVDAFSQTPRPSFVKIGRQALNTVKVGVKAVSTSGTYTVTVSSKDAEGNVTKTPYAYQNTSGNAEAILSGIAGLITADTSAVVTAGTTADTLTLSSKGGTDFAVSVSYMLSVSAGEVTESIPETMTAITKSDNDFYGIAFTSRNQEDILGMAAWTEAHTKLFGTAIAEAGAIDADVATDTGSKLQAENCYRTHWWYHADADKDFPECAVMARCFAVDPGGETWALKKLAGVTTDALTDTEYNAVTKKNGNTFEKFRNVSITRNGVVAAGEYIDVIRFRDWLQEEITVNVFNALINSDKVPYTDSGIAIIENQIISALKLGQTRGGIAPTEYDSDGNTNLGYTVSVPLSSSISANTKASRILEDVKFTARLSGAIHVVEIKGGLTYENLIAVTA